MKEGNNVLSTTDIIWCKFKETLVQIDRLYFKAGEAIHNGQIGTDMAYERSAAFKCEAGCSSKSLTIELQPMEIKTFIATFAGSQSIPVS